MVDFFSQVTATDADIGKNGEIRYELMFGTGGADEMFTVDPISGEIHTTAPIRQAHSNSFILSVRAMDQPNLPSHTR